ncbi:VanZ family protein [Microbacterium sp. 69-10]|uniref:VanZ family protein n=1 Tax=Microbacterium sp. 69-10 TaxID=1895783 RepID=UPI0025CFD987|nr:VanZ family protein [Microbacterium sp. 69-10]
MDIDLAALGLSGIPVFDADAPRPPAPLWRRISTWVGVYSVALALIAFWPVPVDSGAGGFLRWVTAHIPMLTYSRIEFGSNILLFVPFGLGLALLLPKLRYLVLPAALLVSLTIESGQAVFLAQRTPSLYDILANVSGAALGLIVLVVFEVLKGHHRRLAEASG